MESMPLNKIAGSKRVLSIVEKSGDLGYIIVLFYSVFILISSFIFNTPREIAGGFYKLLLTPGILISDYMSVSNVGAAFFNSGFLMTVATVLARVYRLNMNGPLIAAIFTVGGFAFFGKNIFNITPILFGTFLYSVVKKESFGKFLLIALFGTALAPFVSQLSFGYELPLLLGLFLGVVLGIAAGFILTPIAGHTVKFHQGFNIYNVGFTAGIIGTLFMAILRGFGLDNEPVMLAAQGYNITLGIYLTVMFLSMFTIGYILNKGFKGYGNILKKSGRLVTDFVSSDGLGLSLINMGALGLLSTGYIVLIGGEINGPSIGGIFTIVGFAAFGKHLRNIMPIFIGVYLAAYFKIWEVNHTGALLAALFGTTLAPIAGQFGWKIGILAGFLHMSLVMNVGYLHGGMNLYNNGFSGGILAVILVPVIFAFRKVDVGAKKE